MNAYLLWPVLKLYAGPTTGIFVLSTLNFLSENDIKFFKSLLSEKSLALILFSLNILDLSPLVFAFNSYKTICFFHCLVSNNTCDGRNILL